MIVFVIFNSVLQAMSSGCIPITSRLEMSVLEDLTYPFDLGPKKPLKQHEAHNKSKLKEWLEEEWTPAVLATKEITASLLDSRRMEMIKSIRNRYSWKKTAEKVAELVI